MSSRHRIGVKTAAICQQVRKWDGLGNPLAHTFRPVNESGNRLITGKQILLLQDYESKSANFALPSDVLLRFF